MSEDGAMKDDVKIPEGDVGEKIEKLFKQEEKDLSTFTPRLFSRHSADTCRCHCPHFHG